MAKVHKNIILKGLSGELGKQLRIRTGPISGRTNVSAIPEYRPQHEDSPAQKAHKQHFREAHAYAEANKENPVYVAKARGKQGKGRQPRNVAMADWLRPPQILGIDLDRLRGRPGDVIRILAVDDVQVTGVRVEIRDEAGALLETGEATLAVTQRWEYTLQGLLSGPLTVTVYATDLPGHMAQASAGKRVPG